jgi:hypothetical protein
MSGTAAETFDRSLELMYTALLFQRSARALRRRGRPEIRGGSGEARLTHQIIAVVKSGLPFCFPCLANVMMWPEKTIREAAQIVLRLRDFHVRRGVCHRCERTDDMIVLINE